jgi:hypothetical protein
MLKKPLLALNILGSYFTIMDYLHSLLKDLMLLYLIQPEVSKSESSDDNENFYICSKFNRKRMLLYLLVTAAC